jgi:hypothetical protein
VTSRYQAASEVAPRVVLLSVVAAMGWLSICSVGAHDLSISGIRIIYRTDDVLVCVSTHLSQLSKAEKTDLSNASASSIDHAVQKRLHLRFNGRDFIPGKTYLIPDAANDQLSWQATADKSSSDYEVLSRLYPEDSNSITVVSCVRNGQSQKEDLLNREHPSLMRSSTSQPPVMWRYFQQGYKHILSGADHILFLFGLLLLGGSFLSMLRTITAFTLAHSLTLTAAVTGILVPSSGLIEPLIALSIVAIGADNLRVLKNRRRNLDDLSSKSSKDWRPLTAFVFGLIHGFGFAGGIIEIGLLAQSLWVALVSFNLGVEAGQASVVVLVAPLVAIANRKIPRLYLQLAKILSILITVTGAIWFVLRLFN